MVVCKYFLQGTCRFGETCRFEHQYAASYNNQSYGSGNNFQSNQVTNSNVDTGTLVKSVFNDINSLVRGGQWLLSCYAPFKEKPAYPGFEDQSFEEVRYAYYEAAKNNTLDQHKQQLQVVLQNAMMRFETLQHPSPDIVDMFTKIYNTPVGSPNTIETSDPQNSSIANKNSFTGSSSQGNNLFAKSNFTQQNAAAPPSTSIFANTNSSSNFGQATNTNIFANANKSLFGGSSTQAANIFGTGVNNQAMPQSNIFAQIKPQSNIFSGNAQMPAFTNSVQQPPINNQLPPFVGSNQSAPFVGSNQPAPFVGNNQPAPFVGSNQPAPFVGTNQPATFVSNPQSSFSSNNTFFNQPVSNSSPFGNSLTNNSPLMQNTMIPNQNTQINPTFSSNVPGNSIFNCQPTASPFNMEGLQNTNSSSIFGSSAQTVVQGNTLRVAPAQSDLSLYSKLEDLTEEEIKWYNSDSLDISKIPDKPPTYEMCFN